MNERNDIAFKPEWPIINFGDGTWGRVVEIRPSKNSEGVDTYVMKILPGDLLIAFYDIPDEMINEERQIIVEIPSVMIHNVSISPAFPTYWCYLNIFGQTCPGTEFLKGHIEAEKIMGLQKMIDLKKAENAWFKEGYYKAVANNMKWMKDVQGVTDLFSINITQPAPPGQAHTVGPNRSDVI